jgi:hypothetical protein
MATAKLKRKPRLSNSKNPRRCAVREGHKRAKDHFFFPSLSFLFLIRDVVGESSRICHGRGGSPPWCKTERGIAAPQSVEVEVEDRGFVVRSQFE